MSSDLDPKQNHVTFHLMVGGKEQTLSGVGPAQAVDCVSAVWEVVSKEARAQARDVRQIYSEWEPASEDLEFLDKTFPEDAELGYTFMRPKDGQWGLALAAAAEVIAASGEPEDET